MGYVPPQHSFEPTEVLIGCVAVFDNLWPDYKETIESIEKVTQDSSSGIAFNKAKVQTLQGENVFSNKRTNWDLNLSNAGRSNEVFRNINNKFFELTYSAVNWYKNNFSIVEQLHWQEDYTMIKYESGEEYNIHYDGGSESGRCVSPILYLNSDYEGGEIEFVNFGLKIKPGPGTLLLFPATYAYAHIAHKVTSGTKYALVTWLRDRVGA